MGHEEFTGLVARLEKKAERDPAGYQSRAVLLALCGNAYLAAVLLLIVAAMVGVLATFTVLKAIAAKLVFVLGAFLVLVVRAVWIKLAPPEGIEVKRAEAPELFALIDELRNALRSAHFHHVLVTDEFNAAVYQMPRFGVFAGTRNYLLLGIPLMKLLTVEQFKAVLAHEFGHLARGHGRISNWVYCQRLRWARLAATLQEAESGGKFLFAPLFRWFVPYFTAYSFPLARANEYQADAASARLASPRAAAEALTGVNVMASYLQERFWPFVHRQADDLPQPRFMPFSGLGQKAHEDMDPASASRWLEASLAQRTDLADTHPSLAERLKAIGERAHLAPPEAGKGADRLLGAALATVVAQLDERWRTAIQPSWEARHKSVQEDRTRFAAIEARVGAGEELSNDERFDRAVLTDTVAGNTAGAIEQLRSLVQAAPEHVGACYALGVRLLDRDDDAGVALLERVMEQDSSVVPHVAAVLRDYAARRGRDQEARRLHAQAVQAADELTAIEREESMIRLTDTFVRHDLDAAATERLREELQAIPCLKRVYLLRKRVPVGDRYCYVLGFKVSAWTGSQRESRSAEVVRRLQQSSRLPPGTLIVRVDGKNYRFGRKFFWMRGAKIA
jgi:Zn-dependent protease with chaperone function